MTSSSNVPAGMYPDPENPGQSRFWNGLSWEAPGAPAVLPPADVAQVAKKPVWKRKWFLITAGIFAVLVIASIGSAGSSTKTTSQPSAASLPITPSVPALVVPNLVGLPAEQVLPALTALGLTLGPTTYGPSDAPTNQVISQTPAAGTPGVAGGAVSVILSSGPAEPAPAAPAPVEAAPAEPEPVAPAEPEFTLSQQNAIREAESYLEVSAFSKKGLIEQLSSQYGAGFSKADATFAVNNITVNWKAQAVKAAESYLEISGFSRQGLIEQLSSPYGGQFTKAEATYAVNKVGL